MSGKPIHIEVTDPETGEVAKTDIPPGDFLLICAEPCHLDGVQRYPVKGTTVLTVKGHRPQAAKEDR